MLCSFPFLVSRGEAGSTKHVCTVGAADVGGVGFALRAHNLLDKHKQVIQSVAMGVQACVARRTQAVTTGPADPVRERMVTLHAKQDVRVRQPLDVLNAFQSKFCHKLIEVEACVDSDCVWTTNVLHAEIGRVELLLDHLC